MPSTQSGNDGLTHARPIKVSHSLYRLLPVLADTTTCTSAIISVKLKFHRTHTLCALNYCQ